MNVVWRQEGDDLPEKFKRKQKQRESFDIRHHDWKGLLDDVPRAGGTFLNRFGGGQLCWCEGALSSECQPISMPTAVAEYEHQEAAATIINGRGIGAEW
ncbi:hypothetical protein BC938DRAFT_480940, partial [Jimgerdemannia flammicorona]